MERGDPYQVPTGGMMGRARERPSTSRPIPWTSCHPDRSCQESSTWNILVLLCCVSAYETCVIQGVLSDGRATEIRQLR